MRSGVLLGVATLVGGALASGPAQAAAALRPRVSLPGSAPVWARAESAGRVSSGLAVQVRVYLAPRGGQAALDSALAAVSTPGSPSYRHFLTPAQYRQRFEPTTGEVAEVSRWLNSAGFRVTRVEPSRRYVAARGSAAAASRAFGVVLQRYHRDGASVVAPDSDVTVPASVAGAVLGVTGLDTAPPASKPMLAPPPAGFRNARPCSLFYGQVVAKYRADFRTRLPKFHGAYRDYAVCGYLPDQFRAAYGVDATKLSGAGVTVGIVDAFGAATIRQDANEYATRHGDPAFGASQFTQSLVRFHLHPKQCQSPADWAGEETLDVEAVHGMAPRAGVRYYGASSCLNQDLQAAIARADDENRVSVISNSYGGPEETETSGDIAAEEQVVIQGEMQGISFLFASGDNGDWVALTGILQTDYPSSDPYVTSVGGTTTAIGPSGSLDFQTGWGTIKWALSSDGRTWQRLGFLYGSGGGYSTLFNRPAYQRGVVDSGARGVPDLAADADPTTGMLVGETQRFPSGVKYDEYRIGGTSLASPLMAGEVALAAQHAGSRLGFLNPTLYHARNSSAFRDVKPVHTGDGNVRPDFANGVDPSGGIVYSMREFDKDSSLVVTRGWDDVTGLGSPTAAFPTRIG